MAHWMNTDRLLTNVTIDAERKTAGSKRGKHRGQLDDASCHSNRPVSEFEAFTEHVKKQKR